ncbi:ATP-binding protein [Sunxiuqinia dokdonensis]|uniref:histidine kinase n=1 Tax=Sunxiuqinia dokdonensis TaxID=1409788 RepID=A0A0L8VC78_9BACT|nr:ATP-binding protein [Sunxiuqinia dokdonensis]KOH45772.1 histidine kinase [Sunxiuqinia dokdonensis]
MPNRCFLFLTLFLGLTGLVSQAQDDRLADSLEIRKQLETLEHLTNRKLDSALILSHTVYQQASAMNNQEAMWETRLNQGDIYYELGQKDTAYLILNQVLEQAMEHQNRLAEIKARIKLAYNLQEDYRFEPAINHLIEAQRLLQDTDSMDLRFAIFNYLGITHRKMKDYTSALNYFNYLEENYLYQLDPGQRFNLFMNKGNVYAVQRDYDKTEALFNKAYHEIQQIDHPANLALITYNLGALYYRQKRYPEAEEHIRRSLEANLKIGDHVKIERCYRVLGSIKIDQDNYAEAEDFFLKALEIAKAIDHKKSILGNYKNLYLNYWHRGYENKTVEDLDQALTYMDLYQKLNDTLYQTETAEKILELEKQYETEKKNNQITLLEQENLLKEDQLYIQRTQRNFLIIFIILVGGILGIFIYFYYYHKKVNKLLQLQSKRILSQRNKISIQNKKLQKSVDTQNKLFAIIGHDLRSPLVSISNVAKLIGFYMEDKRYDELEKAALMMEQKNDQVLELTDNLLSWAKSQSDDLKPFFEPVSLKEIVEDCYELYQPIAATKSIRLHHADVDDLMVWADRNMLKTICRNLINNAIKFTPKAGEIKVAYRLKEERAELCIEDSGVGIEPERLAILFQVGRDKGTVGTEGEKSSGLGLAVCKEFAAALQGTIQVESQVGQGSRFCVQIPRFDAAVHHPKFKQKERTSSVAP